MKLLCLILLLPAAAWADLDRARAESNLEKRAGKALENAEDALNSARQAYDAGDLEKTRRFLDEIAESVDLAFTSLKETGKNPSRNSKHFKRAEVKTRALLKRLEGLSENMGVADRPLVETVSKRVQKVHDDLLLGIMEGWE
ncbi:MAG: hypothetical protein IT158_24950 [Bryobacterales bacterium]|nr:hypothetical protein [Bryobacterales bacterium]